MKEKYPWSEQDVVRRNMPDREIIDKYVNLEKNLVSQIKKRSRLRTCYINIKILLG